MNVERLNRLLSGLNSLGLDGIVLMPSSNLRYLTGIGFHPSKRLALTFVSADGRTPCLVLPALEAAGVRAAFGTSAELFTWTDAEGPAQALHRAVARTFGAHSGTRSAHIGIEYTTMRVMELRALEMAALANGCAVETIDATPLMAAMRMVKDEDEQAAMAESARILEAALRNTIEHIRPGMTERQLARFCSNAILAAGAEGESFDAFVAAGPNSANPHHSSNDRPFEAGDLIIIDCGAVYGGYASDITRTVALGEPGELARRVYATVLAANTAGRAAVRPNITGEQIDQAARSIITDAGYGDYFPHRTGHGLGLEVHPCHEPPDLVAGSTTPLNPGTTFTIEPGVYIEGVGGVRIEDDVVITRDGYKSFTSFDRELVVLSA
ncbi:MAG: Xaa-Pro peptidase family protein [Chloroflexi bacterium]|nr:Xaa-Pro peptidase family protein [Chloroflexota bacterium]